MPFILILLVTLACLPENWPAPSAWITSPAQSIVLTWLGAGALIGFAFFISGRVRELASVHTSLMLPTKKYLRARRAHTLLLLMLYLLSLYVIGYGWAVREVWRTGAQPWPGSDLVLLLPFLLVMFVSWIGFHSAEVVLGDSQAQASGRWSYAIFQARQTWSLILLPVALLLIEKEMRRQVPAWERLWASHGGYLSIGMALTIFLTMPWLVRLLLGLKPLPPGPLRDRLEATSKRLRFRCSNILLWETRSSVANAMVIGSLPFLRYVLLSDRLIEELSEEEVEAVFGHEIGHVKHHHMLLYLIFLLSSMAILGAVLGPLLPHLESMVDFESREDLAVVPLVIILGVYIFGVFGFLSRRCERQADIYGCRAVSCGARACFDHSSGTPLPPKVDHPCLTGIHVFCMALEKVAIINGLPREKPGFLQSWQHSTIARRVDFLQSLLRDPERELRFQRRLLLLKCGMFAVLGLALLSELLANG